MVDTIWKSMRRLIIHLIYTFLKAYRPEIVNQINKFLPDKLNFT